MTTKLNCIMAIDDDEATNFFTRVMLEDAGCTEHIKLMQSGQEALDYLAKSKDEDDHCPSPDLIFLDINMPAMNGWEFLEKYKAMHAEERVIVVMLTTSLFPADKARAEQIPEITAFENKPLTEEKINNIVERYFAAMKLVKERSSSEA